MSVITLVVLQEARPVFIMSCENHGRLNGRKDVGGIAGQMEPSSQMQYEEDTMEKAVQGISEAARPCNEAR